jgi:hypothetical protein
MVEPWLRGTLTEVDAMRRQVLHALELAQEDADRWCARLSGAELNARPFGVASVAFHLLHIVGSLDRLLTYAEGGTLSTPQIDALQSEMDAVASAEIALAQLRAALGEARQRVMMISPASYEEPRGVGRARLPSTVGSLLVHCAEHTQRHIGQAITTAKVVTGMRKG